MKLDRAQSKMSPLSCPVGPQESGINRSTHRAGAKKIVLPTTDNKIARVFYRQPRWSELQSLVYGGKPPNRPFYGTYVMSASEDVLDGLCGSTIKLIEAMIGAGDADYEEPFRCSAVEGGPRHRRSPAGLVLAGPIRLMC
jgi:hypothetical protein